MAAHRDAGTTTSVFGVADFERFFRSAAGLDVDKDDLKRYVDFVKNEVRDLLLMGHATAEANSRDIVAPHDLPITKGLQESIHRFRALEDAAELRTLLEGLVTWRPQDIVVGEETEARLPDVAGGISQALAESFGIIDSRLKNPSSEHWERATRLFDLLL